MTGADPNMKAADQLLPIHQAAQNQNVISFFSIPSIDIYATFVAIHESG